MTSFDIATGTKVLGNLCKEYGISLEDLTAAFPHRPTTEQECYAVSQWIKARIEAQAKPSQPPSPQVGELPSNKDKNGKERPAYFAIDMDDTVKFYRVKKGWKPGVVFIDAQGSDEFYPIKNAAAKAAIIKAILAQGVEEGMNRYGQEIGRCGDCHRTLTDATSRAIGRGPRCRNK